MYYICGPLLHRTVFIIARLPFLQSPFVHHTFQHPHHKILAATILVPRLTLAASYPRRVDEVRRSQMELLFPKNEKQKRVN